MLSPNDSKKCRWFTRAWTLQELIASDIAVFFDTNWNPVGSKESMVDILTIITGIEPAVMTSTGQEKQRALRSTSVAARVSWASNRNVTRIEDEAYSLFGILDINMPLIYGEGSYAFVRLQKEVFVKSSDHSILLWNTDLWCANSGNWARSPSAFRHCGRITTLFLEFLPHVEAELTNLGIRMTLPVLEANKGDVSAILNCRYEDDFRGPIALPLKPLHISSSSARDEEIRVRRSDVPLLDDNNVCRYPVISEKEIAQAAKRRKVLLGYDSRPRVDVLSSPVRTNFVLNASTFSKMFKLCRVSPEHRFNWNTWILSWRSIRSAAVNQKANEASFTWVNDARNYFLNLRLRIDMRGNIRSRLYKWPGRPSGNGKTDRPLIGINMPSQNCGEHGHYHLEHGVITQKTRPVTMLDEILHVIDLGYEPKLEEILSKSPHLQRPRIGC